MHACTHGHTFFLRHGLGAHSRDGMEKRRNEKKTQTQMLAQILPPLRTQKNKATSLLHPALKVSCVEVPFPPFRQVLSYKRSPLPYFFSMLHRAHCTPIRKCYACDVSKDERLEKET